MTSVWIVAGILVGAAAMWLVASRLFDASRAQLVDTFKALSADALRESSAQFLEQAKADLGEREQAVARLVAPVQESLALVGEKIERLEREREKTHSDLSAKLKSLVESERSLRSQTEQLAGALRSPTVQGRWGEMQLRRVVELAGMQAHCDFSEQATADGDARGRPDMVIHLPGGRSIVVDAKVPLRAYLDSLQAIDEGDRERLMGDHVAAIRAHISALSAKAYWRQFEPAPEFVIMFLPGEVFYSAALQQDPSLLEAGAAKKVLIATPTTLIALLNGAVCAWREERVAQSAKEISALGLELYRRLGVLGGHFSRLGRQLEGSVRAFNEAVGSLEGRVLPTARRFEDHGIAGEPLEHLQPIETAARGITAPELAEDMLAQRL
jgi:DNA recombination protein RmuC